MAVGLAVGVTIGDVVWPVLALLALDQILAVHADILVWLRYIAVVVFVVMGFGLMFQAYWVAREPSTSMRLFGFSNVYLAVLFAAVLVDVIVGG